MNAMQWGIGLVVLVLIGGGVYFATMTKPADEEAMTGTEEGAMMDSKEDDVMAEKDGMTGDDSMEKGEGMMEADSMMKKDDAMMQKGSYEPYAASKLANANEGDVVLFFRATWCPTCRALDADIKTNQDSIPDGLTILDVNYDTETALKQKYGVTVQHTLVQVSAGGTLIKKWGGSPTLAALSVQVQ